VPNGKLGEVVQVGEWIVNPALDSISRGTETHKLEPRTMRLLMCLANSPGAVVSVDRLLAEVWTGVIVGSASVYQAVSQLRKLLGDADPNPTYIATVPRKGYRLIAPVLRGAPAGASSPVAGAPAVAAPVVGAAAIGTPPAARGLPWVALVLGTVALIALIAAGEWVWTRWSTPSRSAGSTASIVVLPFLDLTAEKTGQSFCDGLTEELSNWLSQIPTLRVVARTSALAFRGQGTDVRTIGKELDTNHLLEGSLRRSGDHMRITVQLIDARSGFRLWSENFDRPMEDAIKIQEDISRSVARSLQVQLTPASERQFAARRMADPQAYQLYLLGQHYARLMTPESTDQAIDLFGQVLAADPKFAPVYIELAYARLNQGYFRELPVADVAAQMDPLIASALRIDDRLSGAYAVRGALRATQSRTQEALDDLQFAISLNPSDMGAFAEIGRIRLFDGQPRDALKSYDRAAALDPFNYLLQAQRCTVLDDLAQYEAAEKACERARVLQPGSASAADGLAWLAESRGRIDEALRWNAESLKAEPSDDFGLYWTRSEFFLEVGLAAPARAVVQQGRDATKNTADADVALVRVVFLEGGAEALRSYLGAVNLDRSSHALALFEAAYARLLLGDAPAVKELIARAVAAPDRITGFADIPFYARGARLMGTSYRIDLAAAELALGDARAAKQELDAVLAMLNRMISAGVNRNATYEIRAKVYALQGHGDEAMRDLEKAVQLGWRRAWWAAHEPYFASLRTRGDFQALLTEVSRSNDRLTATLAADR
jgi:TolB-like protein/DNA-binding winged helix-turn-helix (wHTH) protein/Tfp pilus assembly protein PilF